MPFRDLEGGNSTRVIAPDCIKKDVKNGFPKMKMSFSKVSPLVLCSIISACGGGGSSGDEPMTTALQPPVATCPTATTTDRYAANSYDSCNTSNADLTGIWIIISDYAVANNNFERTVRQRSLMSITANSNGTLNAATCNADSTYRNVSFSAGANALQIFDRVAGTPMQLSITSNAAMQGMHIGSGNVVVQRSVVTAKKIRDLSSNAISQVLLAYNFGIISAPPATVDCFTQAQGETRLISLPITFEGEEIYFFQPVDYNGGREIVEANLFIPSNRNNDTEVSLRFLGSNFEIEGEAPANSAAYPQTSITIDRNDNKLLTFSGSLVDEVDSNKFAEFSFAFVLAAPITP